MLVPISTPRYKKRIAYIAAAWPDSYSTANIHTYIHTYPPGECHAFEMSITENTTSDICHIQQCIKRFQLVFVKTSSPIV